MNLNFNEICRLCLRICEECVDLSQTNGVKTLADDLAEKIKYCYFVQVDLSEGFPTKVCYECIQVLSFFYTAKRNVISCDKLLRDILFVRKKLEGDTKNQMTSPDVIEIKQDKQITRPIVLGCNKVEPKKSEQSSVTVELICNDRCVKNSECIAIPDIEETVYSNQEVVTHDSDQNSTSYQHDSKAKRRKKFEQLKQIIESSDSIKTNSVPKFPTKTINGLKVLLKDFKKEPSQQGKTSQPTKDPLQQEANLPLKENVVKEIGTVIDTNNILSPNVKRTRKSISAR